MCWVLKGTGKCICKGLKDCMCGWVIDPALATTKSCFLYLLVALGLVCYVSYRFGETFASLGIPTTRDEAESAAVDVIMRDGILNKIGHRLRMGWPSSNLTNSD